MNSDFPFSPIPWPTDWEQRTELLLNRCLITDVLATQVNVFQTQYQMQPTMVVMHVKLRGALIREVIRENGFADEAVQLSVVEPIWLTGGIPMIFRNLGDDYLRVANKDQGKVLIL